MLRGGRRNASLEESLIPDSAGSLNNFTNSRCSAPFFHTQVQKILKYFQKRMPLKKSLTATDQVKNAHTPKKESC